VNDPRLLTGIGVSPGIAVGRAVLSRREVPDVPHRTVPLRQVRKEIRRITAAVNDVRRYLEGLRTEAADAAGPDAAKIFDGQVLMLTDAEFLRGVEELIRDHRLTAEKAYEFRALEVCDLWSKAESALLRDRVTDFTAVANHVIGRLMGRDPSAIRSELTQEELTVLVMHELSPGLAVELHGSNVVGVVSEEGTRTSHAAILAHSLGMPAVLGASGALDRIAAGERVIIDGARGLVLRAPTEAEVADAEAREGRRRLHADALAETLDLEARTPDGHEIVLRGNLDLPAELDVVRRFGAQGVGLVRTEFLITARTRLPTEEEQVAYFTKLAHAFPDDPVVVRTYDLGGDKIPAAFRAPPERNPFLGWRAIRVCLDRPEIFRPQIRAVLRAATAGNVHLLLPMVTRLDEIEAARALIADEATRLAGEGVPAAASVPLGVMVETPAAAVMADRIAEVVDFMSVGTNDLTQYTLVIDRGNAKLASRFRSYDPAVVRLMRGIVDAGRASGVPVSVCGEMASEVVEAFLLLGLGYTTFSVAAPALPMLRWFVRQVPMADAQRAAAAVMEARTASDVWHLLREALAAHVDLALVDVPNEVAAPEGHG
jgi:phosphotransferase system enzyme I (PtsI)